MMFKKIYFLSTSTIFKSIYFYIVTILLISLFAVFSLILPHVNGTSDKASYDIWIASSIGYVFPISFFVSSSLAENSVINNEKTFFFSGPVDRKSYFFGKICTLLTIICIIFFLMLMIGMIGKAIYPFHQGNYASYQLGSLQLTQYYCGLFLCLLSGIITGVSLKPYSKNDAASIVIFFILFIANVCVALMIQPGSGSTGQPNNAPKLIFDISTLWMMLILFGLSFIIFVFAFLSFIRKDVKI